MDPRLIIGSPEAFVLEASCENIQPMFFNILLPAPSCLFVSERSIPPPKKKGKYTEVAALMMIALVLQSLRQMIICSTCTCRMPHSRWRRSDSSAISERDHRIGLTCGQRCSPSKPSGHCLSLELRFHSCGVTNYTFGLK